MPSKSRSFKDQQKTSSEPDATESETSGEDPASGKSLASGESLTSRESLILEQELTPERFADWIDKAPRLIDGGMGQELLRRGLNTEGDTLWSAHALLKTPGLVEQVHRDYIRAGAEIILTNTYATARKHLTQEGRREDFEALNRTAARLARKARDDYEPNGTEKRPGGHAAANGTVLIAGALPPYDTSYRPEREDSIEEMRAEFRAQAGVLAPHTDLVVCETLSTAAEARAAALGVRDVTEKPLLISWTLPEEVPTEEVNPKDVPSGETPATGPESSLRDGTPLSEAIARVKGLADGVLANCCPPEPITAALPEMSAAASVPVGGYANGFQPFPEGWEYESPESIPDARGDLGPEAYARHADRWLESGARLVGGCCEIGPEHIRRLRSLLNEH